MDFGVDRLVDMIEERFGRRTANGLLVLVMLAVGATCINLIYKFIFSPVTWAVLGTLRHISSGDISVTKWQVANWLISLCVGAALVAFYFFLSGVIFRVFRRRSDAIIVELKAHLADVEQQFSEAKVLQDKISDHQRRNEEFLDFIEPMLRENGIDVGPIREKLTAEKSSNS